MRTILQRAGFRSDYARQEKRGKDLAKLDAIVLSLTETGRVDATRRPHKLHGEWEDYWECHIEANWLLIYQVNENEVLLARTGTHADLFE